MFKNFNLNNNFYNFQQLLYNNENKNNEIIELILNSNDLLTEIGIDFIINELIYFSKIKPFSLNKTNEICKLILKSNLKEFFKKKIFNNFFYFLPQIIRFLYLEGFYNLNEILLLLKKNILFYYLSFF